MKRCPVPPAREKQVQPRTGHFTLPGDLRHLLTSVPAALCTIASAEKAQVSTISDHDHTVKGRSPDTCCSRGLGDMTEAAWSVKYAKIKAMSS